ncbi:hypothetical protein MTR_5g099000 [Medicago truncatula]|uniref:Uncharacterized protein n=1 Tax=Medicago truncatula TaxID=3880 RepID=G7KFE3_MEDTR|nr:hypothetical protein MTR_5g099000 [Medicago truncatula]
MISGPSHSDVNLVRLETARSRSLPCHVHRRPLPLVVLDVTCPPTYAWCVPELHRTGRGLL